MLKGSGLIGQWMLGCQTAIFIAMAEYGFILYWTKFKRPKKVAQEGQVGQFYGISSDLINENVKSLDGWFLIIMPFLFVLFNIYFWIKVTYLSE
jgi:hypothetical protein